MGKIAKALGRHGVLGLIALLPKNAWRLLTYFSARQRRARDSALEFDRRFVVDTAAPRSLSDLDIPPELSRHASPYQATMSAQDCIAALNIEYRNYIFIDYGSGKGRVLLQATEFPFRQIIGVECSKQLTDIARRNFAIYRNAAQRCHDIQLVEGDAGAYEPPAAPTVFFLYNPFDEAILTRALANIGRVHNAARRMDYLIYVDPRHRAIIDTRSEWLSIIDRGGWVAYRSQT